MVWDRSVSIWDPATSNISFVETETYQTIPIFLSLPYNVLQASAIDNCIYPTILLWFLTLSESQIGEISLTNKFRN